MHCARHHRRLHSSTVAGCIHISSRWPRMAFCQMWSLGMRFATCGNKELWGVFVYYINYMGVVLWNIFLAGYLYVYFYILILLLSLHPVWKAWSSIIAPSRRRYPQPQLRHSRRCNDVQRLGRVRSQTQVLLPEGAGVSSQIVWHYTNNILSFKVVWYYTK